MAHDEPSHVDEVLGFWLEDVGPAGWYAPSPGLDATIRERFEGLWKAAEAGRLTAWRAGPRGALALLLLLDQFPRNMFRDTACAFATDARALQAAKAAIGRGWPARIPPPARQFFYLPLMHSELLADQERCVRLFFLDGGGDNLLHARAHRAVIRRFGRFPHRNAALGRRSTPAERDWLAAGGYQHALAALAAEPSGALARNGEMR